MCMKFEAFSNFFRIFYCFSEMCMKFEAFSKKDEDPRLSISEIIDAEKRGYINV